MSGITTHVLDTSIGRPAAGIPVALSRVAADGSIAMVGNAVTDADGRIRTFSGWDGVMATGDHVLKFDTAAYFKSRGVDAFHPAVTIAFTVRDASEHFHVPLLLSPFAFSTYRGS